MRIAPGDLDDLGLYLLHLLRELGTGMVSRADRRQDQERQCER